MAAAPPGSATRGRLSGDARTLFSFSLFLLALLCHSGASVVQPDPPIASPDLRNPSQMDALKRDLEKASDLEYFAQSPPLTYSETKNDRLLDYLNYHGVMHILPPDNKIAISQFSLEDEDEKGIIAVKNIGKGEEILSIPFSAGLVLEPSDPSPYPNARWEVKLAAKLLRERALGNQSVYYDFLTFLPHSLFLPWIFLSPEEFKEVQYEPTVRRMADLLFETSEEFERCDRTLMANATWGDFTWAMGLIWTHSISLQIPISEESHELEWKHMFLPIIDLLYHNHEPNVDWRGERNFTDHLQLKAIKDIKQGEFVLLDHGVYSTEAMYIYYGYVTKDNPMDDTIIFYSLEDAVYWYLQRFHPAFNSKQTKVKEILSKHEIQELIDKYVEIGKQGALKGMKYIGVNNGHEFLDVAYLDPHDDTHGVAISVHPDGRVDARVLGAFAAIEHDIDGIPEILNLSHSEVEPLSRNHTAFLDLMDDQDWEMDLEDAYSAVRRRCAELLMSYPTTVKEDRALLRKEAGMCDESSSGVCNWPQGLSAIMEITIKYRLVKKLTLEKFIIMHSDVRAMRNSRSTRPLKHS